jgi:hypothetical protein
MLGSALNINELLGQAKSYFEAKDYFNAASKYHQVTIYLSNPLFLSKATAAQLKSYANIRYYLGLCYLHLNQPAKVLASLSALPSFEHVIDTLPIHYLRARALIRLESVDEAVKELHICSLQTESTHFDTTWFESRMLLVTVSLERRELSLTQQLLTTSLEYLQEHYKNQKIELNSYMNYILEVHFHLSQLLRMQNDTDSAIQALFNVYTIYTKHKDDLKISKDTTLRASLLTVTCQLFLLLNERGRQDEAFLLLDDFSVFDALPSLVSKTKEQALTALLMYTKLALQKGAWVQTNLALRKLISAANANAENIENKSLICAIYTYIANFYLLPDHNQPLAALGYIKNARVYLELLSEAEQLTTQTELYLLELIAWHCLQRTDKAEQVFQQLMEYYLTKTEPTDCNHYNLLETCLPLFPVLDISPFAAQREVLALELKKYKVAAQAPALLEELNRRLSSLELETTDSPHCVPPALVVRKPSHSRQADISIAASSSGPSLHMK